MKIYCWWAFGSVWHTYKGKPTYPLKDTNFAGLHFCLHKAHDYSKGLELRLRIATLPFFGPIRCPLHLWCLYILLLQPLGSTQPAMSSHSPPLDPPFSLFISAWLILFFLSLSLGRHLARLRRSIPATALQENPVSCYSGSLPLWPLPHHPSKSYHTHKMDRPTYTKILYEQTHERKGNKMGETDLSQFRARESWICCHVIESCWPKIATKYIRIKYVL